MDKTQYIKSIEEEDTQLNGHIDELIKANDFPSAMFLHAHQYARYKSRMANMELLAKIEALGKDLCLKLDELLKNLFIDSDWVLSCKVNIENELRALSCGVANPIPLENKGLTKC